MVVAMRLVSRSKNRTSTQQSAARPMNACAPGCLNKTFAGRAKPSASYYDSNRKYLS